MFHNQFNDVSFLDYVKAFLIGSLTDAIASIYFLLPMWLILLFGNIESKIIKYISLIFFGIGFFAICILNLSDLGYYPITKKRMGAELLDILPEVPALISAYLIDYWYLVILLLVFFSACFYLFKKQFFNYKNNPESIKVKLINYIIVILLFLCVARGGIKEKPFIPFDIPVIVNPTLQWLASNTPFQFLHTIQNKNVQIETYFKQEEAEKIIGFQKQFVSKEFKKKNILFIILESFCSERIGLLSPQMNGYTPFMDSLLSNARTYKYGMANGRMTIDALPSVLSSIPSFMDKNYCYSNYSNNNVHGISSLLEKEGYTTAFFYGGVKTTFGFESFTNINFTKQYFDQRDYDSNYENEGWGVDDHLFLPFVASKLKTMPQPFCASLLTLSLHHPFPIPEPYKTLLDSIKDPIRKSVKYTDLSLQLFFSKIKNEPWFENSIIAICADHNSSGLGYYEINPVNEFSIPISFYSYGDTSFNKIQDHSISQIDMYPTVLDYLGYNRPFVSMGSSALSAKNHVTIKYVGNGLFHLFDYPFALEFDNTSKKTTKFWMFNDKRSIKEMVIDESNKQKVNELTDFVKDYI
ncbi:MAG: sulfatase-like hydrolase/transferase [Bacteroidetes bacterium]|nr:sulfatase-like hydrolase/transferase [Bacteroidota bacterium]